MRNLKKVLSLVLATVMTMGLMMVGANAFSDDASIENGEAVGIVSSLGIIGGYPDGSYKPEKAVSRAEMAKMICVMLNGGEDPVIGVKDVPTYSDVRNSADAWAEEYIEYCSSNGIVSGVGGGKFSPSRPVTGSEAAKMLLVALGYPADITGQEFTGPDWKMNVNTVANSSYNKLYANLAKTVADTALTRDQAAQMIYNALNAYVVEETFSKDITTGKYNVSFDRTNDTMLTAQFNVDIYTAIVLGTETGSVEGDKGVADGKTKFDFISKNNVATTRGNGTLNVTTDNSMLGKEVKVMVQTTKDNKEVVLGDVVLTETNNTLTMTTAASNATKLGEKLDDADLAIDAATLYVVNGYGTTTSVATNAAAHALMGNGVAVEFIDNDDDGKVDYMMATVKSVGKVATYSTLNDGYISITGIAGSNYTSTDPVDGKAAPVAGNATATEVIGFADVAKDDIVLYYVNADDKLVVEACDSVVVTPTSTKGNNATAGGVTYKGSKLNGTDLGKADGAQTTLAAAVSLNKEATFYLDDYGYVVYVANVSAKTQYMLLTGVNNKTDAGFESLTVKGVLADGTKVTVNVAEVNGYEPGEVSYTAPTNGTIVKYTVNNDGTYDLTTTTDAAITGVTKKTPALGNGVTANDKTVFVVKDSSNNWTVYTGINNMPTVDLTGTNATDAFETVKNSSNVAQIVYVSAGTLVGAEAKNIYILDGTPTITKDGDETIYTYKAMINGEVVEGGLVVENVVANGNTGVAANNGKYILKAGLYVDNGGTKVTLNADGTWDYSNLIAVTNVAPVAVTTVGNGVINAMTYDANTKVILIDNSDKAVVEGEFTTAIIDKYSHNVVLVADKDNANLAAYIYVIQA